MKTMKYSRYLKETLSDYIYISYNRLNRPVGAKPEAIKYSMSDAANIIIPYIGSRWNEQLRIVIPIVLERESMVRQAHHDNVTP